MVKTSVVFFNDTAMLHHMHSFFLEAERLVITKSLRGLAKLRLFFNVFQNPEYTLDANNHIQIIVAYVIFA